MSEITIHLCQDFRADSRHAPSQWETSLQSNTISHWLGTNLESAPSFDMIFLQNPHKRQRKCSSPMRAACGIFCVSSYFVYCHCCISWNIVPYWTMLHGIILCMHPANERRRYIVTSSLIGWAHIQNDPCNGTYVIGLNCAMKILDDPGRIYLLFYGICFWKMQKRIQGYVKNASDMPCYISIKNTVRKMNNNDSTDSLLNNVLLWFSQI